MKLIKKLAVTAVLLLLCACSAGTADGELPEFSTDGDTDLGGYNFVYLLDTKIDAGFFLGYRENTAASDAVKKRIAETEKTLNYNYVPKYSANLNGSLLLILATADGTYGAVQWAAYTDSLQAGVRSGYFYPLSGLTDYLDYKNAEKWGDKYLLESMCWNGDIYGVVPISWPEYNLSYSDYLFAVNMDYITRLGVPDPREYLEQGIWTRAQLCEVMELYTSDALGSERVYALTTNAYHFVVSAINTGTEDFLTYQNGEYTLSPYTPQGFESLAWANDFLNFSHKDHILPTANDDTQIVLTEFINGKAVMTHIHASYIFQTSEYVNLSVAYSDIPFAIIPFPLAENMEYGKWKTLFPMLKYATNIISVTDEPEAAATVLNAIYEPLEGFETLDDLKEFYMRNVFHDERDADLFISLLGHTRYSFRGEGLNQLFSAIAYEKSNTVASVLEKYENTVAGMMPNIINIRESFNEVFGD